MLAKALKLADRSKSGEYMKTQDIIDPNFKQKPVILISDEEKLQIMSNPVYFPIFMSLREGYKTVKEMEEDYSKYMDKIGKKEAIKKGHTSDEEIQAYIDKKKRSDKSLYRYVQHLIDANFAVLIGKRVAIDKPMTEKLFARTAKFFFAEGFYEKSICSEHHCYESIANLLGLIYDVPQPNTKDVEGFSQLIVQSTKKITDILFGPKSEEFVRLVENLSLDEVMAAIQMLSLIELTTNPNEYSKLSRSIEK